MDDILLALGIGAGTGAALCAQVFIFRRWNAALPLHWRWVNYVLGDGTLLAAFALWGALTGHLAEVTIYTLILCLGGAGTMFAYLCLWVQETESAVGARRTYRNNFTTGFLTLLRRPHKANDGR